VFTVTIAPSSSEQVHCLKSAFFFSFVYHLKSLHVSVFPNLRSNQMHQGKLIDILIVHAHGNEWTKMVEYWLCIEWSNFNLCLWEKVVHCSVISLKNWFQYSYCHCCIFMLYLWFFFLLWDMVWIEICNINVIGAQALWLKESSFVVMSIICKMDLN
jgi:hypothetical protein